MVLLYYNYNGQVYFIQGGRKHEKDTKMAYLCGFSRGYVFSAGGIKQDISPVKTVYADSTDWDFTIIEITENSPDMQLDYLGRDGDYFIDLKHDISHRIGKKGDYNADYVKTWATVASGTKVIELNGHDISLISTIKDNDYSNDAVAAFNGTIEEGKTYRYSMSVLVDSSYRTESGGVVYIDEKVKASVGDCKTVLYRYGTSLVTLYAYFTADNDESILRGDVDSDGKVADRDAAILLKCIEGAELEPPLTLAQLRAARTTSGDNDIDLLDAVWILNHKTTE